MGFCGRYCARHLNQYFSDNRAHHDLVVPKGRFLRVLVGPLTSLSSLAGGLVMASGLTPSNKGRFALMTSYLRA